MAAVLIRGETLEEFIAVYPWGPEEVDFWTGTTRYQPWCDVADFFRLTTESAQPKNIINVVEKDECKKG